MAHNTQKRPGPNCAPARLPFPDARTTKTKNSHATKKKTKTATELENDAGGYAVLFDMAGFCDVLWTCDGGVQFGRLALHWVCVCVHVCHCAIVGRLFEPYWGVCPEFL